MSLFLSFWMLAASTGFSVNFHYCEGEIVSWSILNDAAACDHSVEIKSCCEKDEIKKCHSPSDQELNKSSCCSTSETTVEVRNEYNYSELMAEITLPQLIILSQFVIPVSIEEEEEIDVIYYEDPLLLQKLEPSFIQSFLI